MPSEPILVNSSISSTGDITAVKFYGDGSGLVNITTTNLPTPRTIAATGDATWSVSFDGTQNVSGVLTLANSGVTAGTYTKVTVDAKGRVTTGANLVAGDLPSHTHTIAQISDGSVLVKTTDTGTVTNTMLAGGITNAKLTNSSITLNGVAVSLGGTATIPSTSAGTLTIGSYLTGGSYNGSGDVTIAANASSANTSSTLVARDASGNFSAGIITATLNGVANNISQYVVNQDVGLTSSPSFTQVTATTSLRASGTNGIVYLNRSSNASISEVNFQTASTTNWKLGLAATATPNISFATADGNSRLTLTQAGVLTVSGGITGVRYPRPSVNNNLGNPTVEEMALFGSQMSNKIRGIVPYLQEESADGNTWTTSTRLTAGQLAGLVIGDGNVFASPTIIPITTVGSSGHYRLVWDATNTGYVWLNAFYAYLSTKGSNVTVKLEIYNNDLASWSTVVSGTVNGWPNHIYIPHDAVLFSTFSGASMHRYARITFSLASSVYGSEYGGVELSSVEWMGGYPAGRRNVEYYDSSLNAHWAGSVYAASFVDENNTTYYLDPSSTGTALTVAGAATVGRGIGGGEAIALVLSSAEGGAGGATSIRAFPRGAGGTSNASARIRFTSSTGPSAGIQFYTGGTVGGVTSESLVLTLNSGATSAAFAGELSVGGNLTVTGSISAASFSGTIASSSTANTLTSLDNRIINPSETSISRAQFGFTSWNNDNTGPHADYLHMRSYTDASGGSDNLVMFRKTGIGMRIWQQTFGSSDAYSTYKDIAFTDGTNATGTWTLNTSGYAAYIQGSEIALAFSAAPRTSTQPFSVKLFDNYNTAGWPAQYGTVMEIYGKVGHQIDQLHFGNDRKIYHRSAFYNENTWTSFQKILEADDTSSTNVGNKVVIRNSAGDFSAGTITANLIGNASTVTNGVYTTGSYANPAWITSLDASKLTGDQTIPNVVLPGQLRTEQISTTPYGLLAAGAWYTIATNDGNRANGKFIITDATPGLHQSVHFYASHHYGAGNKISIIHNDSYGGGGPVRYIRIKEGGTYDGAMLQIYVDDAVTGALPLRIYLYEDVQANGWALKNFIPDGTDPGGTGNFANLTNVAAQVDLDLGATIFSGNIYSGTATNTGQFKVYNTSDASSLTVQNSLVLRDASGAFSAGSITLTGAPLAIGSGGTGATTASAARTSLGATTVGSNLFTLADPSAIRFLRLNADNTVSALSAEDFKTAIGAGSGGGSVVSVSGTGSVNGITLSGTVTTTGSLTLGGTLSNVSLTSQVTGTLPIANGGTNATTSVGANTNIVNFGQLEPHSTYTDFNTVPSTWGFSYVFGPAANAPHANSSQWYRSRLSLGSGYGIGTTASSYWLELAMPRYSGSSYGNLYFRTTEAGVTGAWYGVRAAYAETAGSVTGGIYTTGDQTITGVKTFSDTIKASRIEASSSTNITLVPAGTSGEVAIRRGSDDNLAFTLRPTGANNGYIRSGSATGVFTVDSNDFRVRSYEQDVDRLRITSTESVFTSPLRVTGNLTAGDGLFINTNVASRSYFDANTGAYFHTPGAMVRKDSASNVPGEMPATFVLYNRNGGNDTGTKLVFSSSESSSATANAVATAAIVSQKVSATDGNWGVGNLRFYVKNVGVYEEVLTLNASKTAAFKGPIQLENNVAQYWLDSAGNSRRVSLVSGGNASYFGPVDAGWGSTTYLSAGTAMILRTNGGGGTFVEAVTLATGGNVTVAKDLIVNGTGGITVSTSSGATPVITATSTNGVAGYFVSDGHLNDLQANTSTHFVIKRSKNTATQNRWAMQLQGGENTSDSPVEGSNLVFVYSSAGTGTWTNGLTLSRNGNATFAGSITSSGSAGGGSEFLGMYVNNTNSAGNSTIRVGYNSNLSGDFTQSADGKVYIKSRYNDAASGFVFQTKASATPVNAMVISDTGNCSVSGSFAASGNVNVTSSGGLTLRLGKVAASPFNATDAFIGINDSGGPGSNAGDLLYFPRSSTGIATAHRWFGHNSGTGAVSERMSLSATTGLLTVYGSISTSSSGVITIAGDPTGDRSAITRVWSVSRGENLVTNGSGLMGNNYNFSGLAFDAVQTHGGGGSFRATAAYGSYTSDEFLPVDPEKNYRFALWARSGQDGGVDYSASNLQYAGIVPYDIDGLTIFPFTYSKYPGSTDTTLAATLNPGDTTVTLTSTAGWANTGSANYQRQFGWYGYTNSKGYTYPNYTYTRNYTWNYTVYQGDPAGAWSVGGISGNVITLNAPWPGPTVAAGTAIRNINSGGTFKYITLGATSVPNTWTRYEGYIGGLDTGGTQNTNQFPYGTAFVKLLFLSNYHGVANNTIRFSDLWFSEMSSRNLEPATDTFAGVVSTTTQTFAGSKSFSTDVRAPIFYDSVDTGYWISPRSSQTSSEGGRIKRNFTVNAEGSGTGYGLALYPQYTAQALPTYGIVFGQTGTLGTHGSVSGDWATYFTMNNSSGRGWVYRNTSDGINVASISNAGNLSLSGSLTSTQNSNTVVDGIRIINTNGGTSTAIRNTLNNGAYDGGLWMGGQAFTNNNFYRANRVSLVGPFDLNYVSGQHFFWLGTGGTSNDPTNASQVLTITLGGRMVHSPIAHSTAAWTTLGALNEWRAATVTNSTTAASGTVATAVFNSFGASTLAATNASVTTTNAATVYIAGGPAAGANQTITNSWGLWNVGRTKLTGSVKIDDNSSSYSTASGALVVDGGLGVGGAIYSGNLIVSSGSGAGFAAEPRDGSGYRATWYNPTGDDMQLDFAGIGTKFTITSAGNTTIAGTLTASGATGTFGTSASAGTSLRLISGVGTLAAPKYSTLDFRNYNDLKSGAYIRTGNRESDTHEWLLEIATRSNADVLTQIATFSDTKLSILASTISNSTSSGALVVNGGVGVGGNITVGGQVDLNSGSAAAPSLKLNGTNNGLFYNGSNIVRISANGTLAASIGVSGSEFSGVLTAGSGTHTFGNAAANTVLEVSRITNNPSGIQLQALDSHSLLNFTTSTPGYTWGRIGSNGNEILRIYNAGLTAITAVSGGGLAIGGGLNVNGNATFAGDITISTNTKAFYNTAYANAKGTQVGYFSRGTSGGWTSGIHFDSSNTNYSATFVHDPTSGDLRLYTNSTTSNYTASDIALTVGANRSATFTGSVTVNGTTLRSSNTISIDSGTTANRYDIYRDNSGAVYPIGHLVSYGSQTGYGGFTWANLDSGKLLEITNAGAVTAKTSLTVNRLFAQTRKLEAHVPHTVSTEDYLRIASNSGSTNTYGGEFGYGLTAAGDPEVRFNRVHAGTVTNWLTVPTNTGNATFAGSITTNTSLGVGTTASGTSGEIRATNNITAYYSDERLKTRLGGIEDPLKKVMSLSGFYFAPNDTAMALGYQKKIDVGVSAQEVQKVLPEIIAPAPIDPQYMTVRYEKMIPLLIEAIKEQQSQIEELKNLVAKLTNK